MFYKIRKKLQTQEELNRNYIIFPHYSGESDTLEVKVLNGENLSEEERTKLLNSLQEISPFNT